MTDTADNNVTNTCDNPVPFPMRIAITGGTGFVGRHFARLLIKQGHRVVLLARGVDTRDTEIRSLPNVEIVTCGLDDVDTLARAFAGCDAVAHCAGINREAGDVTYNRVHVEGTRHVVAAARQANVARLALVSFLRARPGMTGPGAGYFESKWQAEQIVRESNLDYTILKCGVIYGRGDHMLDHLSHALHTFPVFGFVGMRDHRIAPVSVNDVARILHGALVDGRLTRKTVAVLGPDTLTLREAVRKVAHVVYRRPLFMRTPVWFTFALAWCLERTMTIPMVALAQARMLSEGIVATDDLDLTLDSLPKDMIPTRRFTDDAIRAGLPARGRFGLRDCRCLHRFLTRAAA